MEPHDLREIMGAQGGGQQLYHHPGARMEQRQQVGNGETAPRQLFAGLAEMVLQCRGIGHGKTRAIDPKGAMAQPAPFIEWFVLQCVAHGAEQLLEHCEREFHARLTIGGSRHVKLGEMTQMRARSIPMKDLDKKQLDRRHRIKRVLPPPIGDATTGRPDGLGRKLVGPILLKLFDDLGDRCCHQGSPLGIGEQLTPHTGDRQARQLTAGTTRLTSMNKGSSA
jgi:hypothetical protein